MTELLSSIESWFAEQGWEPLPYQRVVWEAMREGHSGLVHSSTGTGKTYAIWMGLLQRLATSRKRRGLRVLWITPLRALAADTVESLLAPLGSLGIDWKIEMRTGDTSSSAKQRQMRTMPEVLVTTPETLTLLLSYGATKEMMSSLDAVVMDEWHELVGSKRGVQAELALARLRTWNPALLTWGLSATLGNTELAADVLLGNRSNGRIVQGDTQKTILIDSLLPEVTQRFPWAGHMGIVMLPKVAEAIAESQSTLVFLNTRAQAEIWFQGILDHRPELKGQVALHHGSLDREVREAVERGLKVGKLKGVVSTSSLDLGVDFSPVERVIQVGSPKGVARLLQRAGRSGHQPGAPSRVTCVPTHALELIDIAALRTASLEGRIEGRTPLNKPLDVLCQHLVTLAMGGGFTEPEIYAEITKTYAYRNLLPEELEWCLNFVTQGGFSLRAYPEYRKVAIENGRYLVQDPQIERRHRMNIGTIVSDSAMRVRYLKGADLGSIEESFVSRLRKGDVFVFAGKALEFIMIKDMTCLVRNATKPSGPIPRWAGGRMPLSSELAQALRRQLEQIQDGELAGPELELAAPMLQIQARWSAIPAEHQLLVEQVQTREGHHLFFFPVEGRQVHEGLAALLAWRLTQIQPITFSIACNDYGFEMLSATPLDLSELSFSSLFRTENLAEDIAQSLNATEMAKRQFREIARVAGLVFQGYPGAQKSTRQIQSSSGLLFEVFSQYEPDHLLLHQANREVLERNLEESRLTATLRRLQKAEILLTHPPRPSPFAFPLMVDRLREQVTSENVEDRVGKMLEALERAADAKGNGVETTAKSQPNLVQ